MRHSIRKLVEKLPWTRGSRKGKRIYGAYPPGHYYSPIPSREEVLAYLESRKPPGEDLPGIELNREGQYSLLNEYAELYGDLPFPKEQDGSLRFYYDNSWFSYSDAIFLYCFLRKYQPRRIIEVGSGFSSAVMLDTVDLFFSERPEITFIEPFPDRLNRLLRDNDRKQVNLVRKKLQEVPSEVFAALGPGDLLFVDSSHVVKCGSDLQRLMFDILPQLEAGVVVHFHDVFYPFDYPDDWLIKGRYWNENYFLRAFLTCNTDWNILFFNTYVHFLFGDMIREKMPLCAVNPGGSLYIQRAKKEG